MSLREWLIAIGTLVIVGIVIDGIRRMRRARKESMAISSGMGADGLDESPLDEDYNPELPNGGARTVSPDTLEQRGYLKREGKSRFANPEPKPTRPVVGSGAPEPARSDDGPAMGTAMEEPSDPADTGWGALDEEDPDLQDGILGEPRIVAPEKSDEQPADRQLSSVRSQPQPATDAEAPLVTSEVEDDTARRQPARHASNQPLAGANRPEAREVVVINVLAKSERDFRGTDLKKLFEACGLEYGDMGIYHRHEQADTTSPVQFSVANAVEPGTFRPEDMTAMRTPGISFFMSLPGPTNALQAFEFMLETAQCVVHNMGGELKDERRSVMTPQTIEHCRQRIREFERKQRSHKAHE